jgi:hypothetical protein
MDTCTETELKNGDLSASCKALVSQVDKEVGNYCESTVVLGVGVYKPPLSDWLRFNDPHPHLALKVFHPTLLLFSNRCVQPVRCLRA